MKEKIIRYLMEKYNPNTIILYGSYSNGTNNENSDFDALIIVDKKECSHDGNTIEKILLDVFIYEVEEIEMCKNYGDYIQIYDGEIILDKNRLGERLKKQVNKFVEENKVKEKSEKIRQLKWCEKMLLRAKRGDCEGYFRWHWLLVDSLEVYYILKDEYYFGPKKMIKKLEKEDKEGFELYNSALKSLDYRSLKSWIDYMRDELLD